MRLVIKKYIVHGFSWLLDALNDFMALDTDIPSRSDIFPLSWLHIYDFRIAQSQVAELEWLQRN